MSGRIQVAHGDADGGVTVLALRGVLDGGSYGAVRDTVVEAALGEPSMVVVDVDDLVVPAPSAWSVFSSAQWQVGRWPAVPIGLVSAQHGEAIRAAGVTRHLSLYPTTDAACRASAPGHHARGRRATIHLVHAANSVGLAQEFVWECFSAWSRLALAAPAAVAATVLVENVLQHTDSAPRLIVESRLPWVAVAAEDDSRRPAQRHEDTVGGADPVSGLAIVTALSRAWGTAATPNGKTVWAVFGPENRL
jgi:hypothetical protein